MLKTHRKEPLIRVCPRCGSRNVVTPRTSRVVFTGYLCGNCGFYSVLFPQIGLKEAKKLDRNSVKFSRFKYKRRKYDSIINFVMIILIFAIFLFWIRVILNGDL